MKDDVQDSETGDGLPLRRALRAILDEGEHKVPSTTANIMASIQREQQTAQKVVPDAVHDVHAIPSPMPFPQVRAIETPRPKRSRRTLYNALALTAVAAVLIASFGLLRFVLPPSSASMSTAGSSGGSAYTMTKYPPFIPATTTTWSAVIITYKIHSMITIANYNPVTATSMILASLPDADTIVHSVSHDGHKLLYSVYDGFKTSYYIYPQATTNAIFTTPDKSHSAIWSIDDRALFISTIKGVMSVDVQTHHAKMLFPTLASVTLTNSRSDGYLYFIKGGTGQVYAKEGTFNRINIAQGYSQQITPCVHGTNFWLSPSGVTVYYNCPDQDATILYAVNGDGTNPHVFSFNAGNVIGYAEDGSPLLVVNANGKYQVVQRNLNTLQDKILSEDVVPGATSITTDNIAVAPYGHILVAKGTYSNNSQATEEQFWYSNLATNQSRAFTLPQGASMSQAIGWDKLQVVGNVSSPTP